MLKGKPASSTTNTTRTPKFEKVATNDHHSGFLRFITPEGYQFGYPFSQLLQFVLEPHSDPAAPQVLHLSFSSHDVIISGFRLHLLCEQLDQGHSLRLCAEDPHFVNDDPTTAFVSDIRAVPLR